MSAVPLIDDAVRDPRDFVAYLLADLDVDHRAQRPIDGERVRRIAHGFDWLRFETPTVVEIGGGRARVIEGQHRVLALRLIADETTVVTCARLPIEPSESVEAAIAYAISRGRQGHSAYARWLLLVNMEAPHELAAERVLAERRLRIGASPAAYTISAVATVSRTIHGARRSPEIGADLLARTLDVLGEAFPPDEEAIGSRWDWRLLRAVSELLARNEKVEDGRLVRVLRDRASHQWIAAATHVDDQPVWETMTTVIAGRYNRLVSADRRIA